MHMLLDVLPQQGPEAVSRFMQGVKAQKGMAKKVYDYIFQGAFYERER